MWLVLAALAVLRGGAAAPAWAHASLVASDPAEGEVLTTTPDVVTLTFDEPVSLPDGAVQLFDAAGEPVPSESSARDAAVTTDLPETLADGSYVVVWRAVSADGHPIAGSLTFAVGAPSAVVTPPQLPEADSTDVRVALSVVQGVGHVGLLLATGLVVLLAWTVRGVRIDEATRRRLGTLVWAASGIALLAAAVLIPLNGAYQQGLGLSQLGESAAVDHTLVGDHLLVLLAQLTGLSIALGNLDRVRVALTGAALAALSPAAVGHTRATEPLWLLISTDALHLAAGATWFGGLVGLVLVLRSLAGRERDCALVLGRFSALAATTLGLLAVTGTLMGWRILGGWDPLLGSTYGRLLLLKVAIALVVASVAGWNRWRLLPSVSGVGHGTRRNAALRVRHAVRVEAGLLVVLLGVTGFLTNQSPLDDSAQRPARESRVQVAVLQEQEGTRVLATMEPRTPGATTITVQVQDQAGEPFEGIAVPRVSAATADGSVDLGPQTVVPSGVGTYVVETVIPAPGTWEVQVSLRVSEFDNPVTTLTFEVT